MSYCKYEDNLDSFEEISLEIFDSDKPYSDTQENHIIRHIDLILIGKTGHGKSATGNSIIGIEKFPSEPCAASVTHDVQYEVTRYRNYVIKVVDTPGMADTSEISDPVLASKRIMKQMQNAVILNPDGYHAFLLVFKYGCRFTKEEHESNNRLKHIFGDTFIKNYCILIVTYGDHFVNDSKKRKMLSKLASSNQDEQSRFDDWLNKQSGRFQELIKECGNRVVLFNNYTKDKSIREYQLNELIRYVNLLDTGGKRYRDRHFDQAEKSRKQILDLTLLKFVKEEQIQLELILNQIASVLAGRLENDEVNLEKLLFEAKMLYEKLIKNDHQHELHNLFSQLTLSLYSSIEKYLKGMEEEEKRRESIDQKLKDESKRLADVLYRYVDDGTSEANIVEDSEMNGDTEQLIETKIDAKKEVIKEIECVMPIKTIIADHFLVEKRIMQLKNDLLSERLVHEKKYTVIKNKCDKMLTKNSLCSIS